MAALAWLGAWLPVNPYSPWIAPSTSNNACFQIDVWVKDWLRVLDMDPTSKQVGLMALAISVVYRQRAILEAWHAVSA